MMLKKFRSSKYVSISLKRYRVQWDAPCRSKFQTNVKKYLQPYWNNHVVAEEVLIPGTRYRIDLVNFTKKIIVETSGEQHFKHVPYFQGASPYGLFDQFDRDEAKREWAKDNGFIFVEIFNEDMPLTKRFFKDKYDIDL